jgi:hypothetical protein
MSEFSVALDQFGAVPPESLYFLTVICQAVVGGIEEVRRSILHHKTVIQNRVRNAERSIRDFERVRLRGWFEVDLYDKGMAQVEAYKRDTLLQMGSDPDENHPLHVVHLHALLDIGGLSPDQVRRQLRKDYPSTRQIELRGLYETRTLEENIGNIVGYSMKLLPYRPKAPRSFRVRGAGRLEPEEKVGRKARVPALPPALSPRARRMYAGPFLRYYVRMLDSLKGSLAFRLGCSKAN